MPTKELRPYQIEDLAFYIANKKCANLSEPATGKTGSACVYLEYLWKHQESATAFVMPKSLLKKNYDEILAFTNFTEDDIVVYDGTPKQREKLLEKDYKVWLCGFDMFGKEWHKLIVAQPKLNALVVDEWHMGYGGHSSNRTQSMYRFTKRAPFFLAMTGTIINGRLSSAFPLLQVIEPRYYPNIMVFNAFHAILDEYDNVIAWRNHDKLGEILRKHSIRRTFTEVYGEEAKVLSVERVPMSKKQRKLYDEFSNTALLELEKSFLDGTEPGVHAIRCRQLMAHPESMPNPAGGGFLDLMKGEVTGKDERLLVHLEDHKNNNKPLLIFATLKPEQRRIEKLVREQGLTVELINSDTPTKKRDQIDAAFRAGTLQVVVGSPATMGVGFNWDHLDHVIFASIDYQDSSFVQGYRRGIRGKRERPLLITVLEYEDSIDQRLFEIVQRKSKDANLVDPTVSKISFNEARKEVA